MPDAKQDNWSTYRAEIERSVILLQRLKDTVERLIDVYVLAALSGRVKALKAQAKLLQARGQKPGAKKAALAAQLPQGVWKGD